MILFIIIIILTIYPFKFQVQDGDRFLLCWLSFDYTSKIFGQLVVTVSPQFIFRNHFPYPVTIKANARDNNECTEMMLDGKGCETHVCLQLEEKRVLSFF